ncbi:MAG: AMED_5909 family protein [Pseudonocardiaceae bacterium]
MTTPKGVKKLRAIAADETPQPVEPRTLDDAHEAVAAIRRARTAPLVEWLAFHQRSAAVYAEVAEIDRGHHHETLFMAERERQRVTEIKAEIASSAAGEK